MPLSKEEQAEDNLRKGGKPKPDTWKGYYDEVVATLG